MASRCCIVWGMTETSPVATISKLQTRHRALPKESRRDRKVKQGRAVFGVEIGIRDGDDKELPRDGQAFGDLLIRGPWIARCYYKMEDSERPDGWFFTGDVATIDAEGFMQITDRSKDVIKSGGEWISSIELENLAMAHPEIAEAAVIGVKHPKWDERPLVIAVRKPGSTLTAADLLASIRARSPNGGCRMTSSLSMNCRMARPASCSRPDCASSTATINFNPRRND